MKQPMFRSALSMFVLAIGTAPIQAHAVKSRYREADLCDIAAYPYKYVNRKVTVVGFRVGPDNHSIGIRAWYCENPSVIGEALIIGDNMTGEITTGFNPEEVGGKSYWPALVLSGTIRVKKVNATNPSHLAWIEGGNIIDIGFIDVSRPATRHPNWIWRRAWQSYTHR